MAEQSHMTQAIQQVGAWLNSLEEEARKRGEAPFLSERVTPRTWRARWEAMTPEAKREAIGREGIDTILERLRKRR